MGKVALERKSQRGAFERGKLKAFSNEYSSQARKKEGELA